jgi:L-lactate dehydrogenase complex protein LldG
VGQTRKIEAQMNARDEILARIQRSMAAVARASADAHAAIPRGYIREGTLNDEERLDLFEERLRDYGTDVHRCTLAQLPETIAAAMRSAGVSRIYAAESVPDRWLPAENVSFVRDDNASNEDLDHSEGVLTTCAVAIALTGTIVLSHDRDGRRALTLIPDYHLCIVKASQVAETVPEAIRALDPPGLSPITTISGPSATSDIEMTRIKGVHGPRRLAVILSA